MLVRGAREKMSYLNKFARLRLALGVTSLFLSVQMQAMTLACANPVHGKVHSNDQCTGNSVPPSYLVDNSPGAKALATPTHKVLQFNPPRSGGPLAESTPLLLFVGIVIAVLLVRAKSLNGK